MMNLIEIEEQFQQLSYNDKLKFYISNFSSGSFNSEKFSDKIAIVSLLCLVTKKMREKNIGVSVKDVVEKIINKRIIGKDAFERYLLGLCIVCEEFLYNVNEIDNFGFTNSKDIITKINQLLNEWMPF